MTTQTQATLCELLSVRTAHELMDALQDQGLVSDLCVTVDDVPELDALRAIATLRDANLRAQGQSELF